MIQYLKTLAYMQSVLDAMVPSVATTLFTCAFVALTIIIGMSLWPKATLARKTMVYTVMAVLTVGGLTYYGNVDYEHGHAIHHHLWELFAVDFPKFIGIPLLTVCIAAMQYFNIKAPKGAKIGWFLWLATPIIANVATTWAMVPIMVSLFLLLRSSYPKTWAYIAVCVFFFSGNMLALGTLAADPPQAFLALKEMAKGQPLDFFWPLEQFWVFLVFTQLLFGVALARLGVRFGSPTEMLKFRPENWSKFIFGTALAACIGVSVTLLDGSRHPYEVPMFLGVAIAIAMAASFVPGFGDSHARHTAVEWAVETAVTFVAFFCVVAFILSGTSFIEVGNGTMTAIVIWVTGTADNAAAFAIGYEHFAPLPIEYQVWYNLFESVTYGSMTPLGNGPQIVKFLVILVGMGVITARQVFEIWLREAMVFIPYLLVWTFGANIAISKGWGFDVPMQALLGIVAFTVALQCMDLQRKFRRHVFSNSETMPWDGRESLRLVADVEEDDATDDSEVAAAH